MYVESAFPLRYPSLAGERRAMLSKVGVLAQPPLIEPVPMYPSSGLTLEAAAAELPTAYQDLDKIAAPLFPDGRTLYTHQWRALLASVERRDVVVTTGTGSGKTEAFMLPLFASLAAESRGWTPPEPPTAERHWWRGSGDRVSQWQHTSRPHALRALVLYPLNALVEDQMRRLRSVLDSPEVSRWVERERQGNHFTFGRYTGLSPVAGDRTSEKVKRLRAYLRERDQEEREVRAALRERGDGSEYHFPSLGGGEMWSRWDAQDAPPDLLITNYSMLNIMLMRAIEQGMFEQTRQWLASDSNHVFHLVVDELHAYRGTPGTEVSYILRLLFERLGLEPDSPQLRILATSASLEGDDRTFLSEFFGRSPEGFEVIGTPQCRPARAADLSEHNEAFGAFGHANPSPALLSGATDVTADSLQALTAALKPTSAGEVGVGGLAAALEHAGVPEALRAACWNSDGGVRATPTPALARRLFGNEQEEALRGMLLALGEARGDGGGALQPVRAHLFFQNVQNLWACTLPSCRQLAGEPAPNIGVLHETHRLACDCGSRVLDLIVCEVCGEVFLGGQRKKDPKYEMVSADRMDLEGVPDQLDSRAYDQYAMLWPVSSHLDQTPERDAYRWGGIERRWQARFFERKTGRLIKMVRPPDGDDDLQPVWVYTVTGPDVATQSAFPPVCPSCDADYTRRDVLPTPLRHHRTGFQKAAQVLASTLMREVDAEARKLVVFSDSRQDAARLAAGMERDHYRDMVRVALLGALEDTSRDLEATVRFLLQRFDTPDTRARLEEANPLLLERALESPREDDQARYTRFVARSAVASSLTSFLMDLPLPEASQNEARALLSQYPARVPLGQLRDDVFARLLTCGTCPGGNTARALYYREGNTARPWHEAFLWAEDAITVRNQVDADQHARDLKNLLLVEMMMVLFTHQVRTLETVGQGFVHAPLEDQPARLGQATDAIVRFLAVKRRYANSEFVEPGDSQEWPRAVKAYLKCLSIDEEDARRALLRGDLAESSQNGLIVRADKLVLVGTQGPGSRYRCQRCRAVFLHEAAGRCIHCTGLVVPDQDSSDDTEHDYYAYLAREAGGAFRLNAEELTGQTDSDARAQRQRFFQEVFLQNENETPQGVDMLSVTTTMEAGVDIGSLNAVLMSNMPPRRFNYQQRVGRAGRRGSSLSLAVTLCRGRSHDTYYYANTEAMTGDPPPSPYVDTASVKIFERVLNKEVLRRALGIKDASESSGESVHGEFGTAADWQNDAERRVRLRSYLTSPDTQVEVTGLARVLARHTRLTLDDVERAVRRLQELPALVDEVVQDPRFTQEALSERLAHRGLLPMFGFPTRTRLLYLDRITTISGRQFPPRNVVDRDLEQAIGAFAPGAEVVRDKLVHRAVGVINLHPAPHGKARVSPGLYPPLSETNQRPLGVCQNCHAVHESAALGGHIGSGEVLCPTCEEMSLRVIDTREPRHFYTDGEPRDYNGFFEIRGRATRPTLAVAQDTDAAVVGNALISGSTREVLTFNDYSGRGGFLFVPDKALSGAYRADERPRLNPPVGSKRIALLARRHTDTLQVGLARWPDHHHAPPDTVEGRAAWYSLAFALRNAAATMLDVEAGELECGLYVTQANGRAEARAFMSDRLENGAGYATHLAEQPHFLRLLRTLAGRVADAWHHHAAVCDSSCALCLRDYTNLPYHPILDWRLALDMVTLLSSDRPERGLEFDSSSWQDLVDAPNTPMASGLKQLSYERSDFNTRLPVFVRRLKRQTSALVIKHPLWLDDHPYVLATRDQIFKHIGAEQVVTASPFLLLRRPSEAM